MESNWNRRKSILQQTRTKTVATVGPACASREMLQTLILEGADVFRLNMAHGGREQHQAMVGEIRAAGEALNTPVGILADLAGPKIRLRELHTDPILLKNGGTVSFVRGNDPQNACEFTCSYEPLLDEIKTGNHIMLCDGLVCLEVESNDGERAICRVVDGGTVRSRQGVNLPDANLGIAALLDVDKDNALWAAENELEFVSLSFVRKAEEIHQLKNLLRQKGSSAMVIAKIEKREALEQLESIVKAADAVMVARGDLGVEIDIEKTPLAQKRIIKTCQQLGKPVIVATQMLESMHDNMRPTRAEVSDVANAILDGADACMLSGETAIGSHPAAAVAMMRKIKHETEQTLAGRPSRMIPSDRSNQLNVSDAVVLGAAQIAQKNQSKDGGDCLSGRARGAGEIQTTRFYSRHCRDQPEECRQSNVPLLGDHTGLSGVIRFRCFASPASGLGRAKRRARSWGSGGFCLGYGRLARCPRDGHGNRSSLMGSARGATQKVLCHRIDMTA